MLIPIILDMCQTLQLGAFVKECVRTLRLSKKEQKQLMRIVYGRECCKYYDDLLPGVCLKRAIRQIRNRAGTWKCTMECDEFELREE